MVLPRKLSNLKGECISSLRLDDDRQKIANLKFIDGATLIEDVGDLKLGDIYNPSYIPWVIVKTTVSDETNLHAGW